MTYRFVKSTILEQISVSDHLTVWFRNNPNPYNMKPKSGCTVTAEQAFCDLMREDRDESGSIRFFNSKIKPSFDLMNSEPPDPFE